MTRHGDGDTVWTRHGDGDTVLWNVGFTVMICAKFDNMMHFTQNVHKKLCKFSMTNTLSCVIILTILFESINNISVNMFYGGFYEEESDYSCGIICDGMPCRM